MKNTLLNKFFIGILCGFTPSLLFAHVNAGCCERPFYAAVDVGIFQANLNQTYTDQTDLFAANISESILGNGYTLGLHVGYMKWLQDIYFLGGELSAYFNTGRPRFQSGAASTLFSDTATVDRQFDLTLVPGLLLTESIMFYGKVGLSYAMLTDKLNSPVGFLPDSVTYNRNRNVFGLAAGLGLKKYISNCFTVYTEYNYHDYGNVQFANFQNFTASYAHSARVYTHSVTVGLAYRF